MVGKSLVSIVSAGMSKFGKIEGMYGRELFAEAADEAFQKCPKIDPKRNIQALIIGQMIDCFEHQSHVAPALSDWTGLLPTPAIRVEAACASSSAAIRYGILAILSGV